MSSVVLIAGQAPSNQFFNRYAGPYRLATELRANQYSTKVVVGAGYYSKETLIEMLDRCIDNKTLVLGISTTFMVDYAARSTANDENSLCFPNRAIENINAVICHYKTKFPNLKVVLGGPSCRKKNIDPEFVDLYVEGYADNLLVDYVKDVDKQRPIFSKQFFNKKPFYSNPLSADFKFRDSKIIFEDEDNIIYGETLPLEISRGCIFKCKFCSFPLKGRSSRDNSFIKTTHNLKEELERNYDMFGTTKYIFCDDTFNDSVPKMEALYEMISSLPFSIEFAAYIRLDLLYAHQDTIDLLKKMGLRGAFFGIETLDETSKKNIGKGQSPDKTLRAMELVNQKWKDEISVTCSFIYGLPGETIQTMDRWTSQYVFGTNLFYKHDLIFQPLTLLGSAATYKTDIDLDLKKFNYTIKNSKSYALNPQWVNNVTSYDAVKSLATDANIEAAKTDRSLQNFSLVTLMGYGLTYDEVKNLSNKRDASKIKAITEAMFNKYKKRCLEQ